jgi:DNA-binding beta-propeller fold protein YncE
MYGTAAFDTSTGKRLWVARYRARRDASDAATAIAVSPDGTTVFVTGFSADTPNVYDYATIAYDTTTGAQRWVARFDDANHGSDTPWSVAVSPDGALVFVTGAADYSGGHGFGATIAYDAATGGQVWKTVIPGGDGPNAAGIEVVASPDGLRVFVIGARDTTTLTFAYDAATGAKLWTNAYHHVGTDDSPSSGVVSRDASTLYVSGTEGLGCCQSVYFTIAYDTLTGARRWAARSHDPDHAANEATSSAVSPDGTAVFVTGFNNYYDLAHHFTTIAYDTSDGHLLWRRFYAADIDSASAYSIAVSPDGNRVVVAGDGYFTDSSSADYVTIAYDAGTGAQVWRARYDGPQHFYDSARAVAIDPTGSRVFVTGLGPMIAYAL